MTPHKIMTVIIKFDYATGRMIYKSTGHYSQANNETQRKYAHLAVNKIFDEIKEKLCKDD